MTDSEDLQLLTEMAPDHISKAYWTFKGGSDVIGSRKASELLDVTQTARIKNGKDACNWAVQVCLDVDNDEVPSVIMDAADAHNLTEIDRTHNYDGTLDSVLFGRP